MNSQKNPNRRQFIERSSLALAGLGLGGTALAQAVSSQTNNPPATVSTEPFNVAIRVDATKSKGDLHPIWRFFGADEPNYATMKYGQKLIGELGAMKPKQVYFRAHNLLNTGDGTPAYKWGSTNAYTEDAQGNPVYDWTIVDKIFDTYLERGVRPYAEIGFMPKALSTHPDPYQHSWTPQSDYSAIYTGWSYPPTDYKKWGELAYQWVKHCVEKYGKAEVETWYWEVWNEADIGYWKGTMEDFHKLHDYAIDGVRRALPTAKVGGPDAAGGGGRFERSFLEHCVHGTNYATGQQGTPIDFVSFHAKGAPTYVNGENPHVRMGISNQLRAIDGAFRVIASFPELKDKPIVIGESDPDGCAACQGRNLGYRNTTMFSSYTAAVFARKHELMAKHGVNLEGALSWAFEFEGQPFFAGQRTLASNGLDKPVLNIFRMFSQMGGQWIESQSDHGLALDVISRTGVRGDPDISSLASVEGNKVCVMVWHYHDDDVPGPDALVEVTVDGVKSRDGSATLRHFRIDEDHSNAFNAWKKMGSPAEPSAEQYAELEKAGQLAEVEAPQIVRVENGKATLKFKLPRHGVSLLALNS